jgi:hypothetical protein
LLTHTYIELFLLSNFIISAKLAKNVYLAALFFKKKQKNVRYCSFLSVFPSGWINIRMGKTPTWGNTHMGKHPHGENTHMGKTPAWEKHPHGKNIHMGKTSTWGKHPHG